MMQILEVVLFGKNKQRRVVRFKENSVNIIQSDHNTGKSSLIDIIEYCLGQQKNHINSTKLRDLVSWFGLTIKLNNKKIFIARKNVEFDSTTDMMYFEYLTGSSPEEPPAITNISRKQFIDFLSSELDIAKIPLEYKENENFYATIRHALFFCYLTQNEIDATDFLYHRSHDGFINVHTELALEYFLGTFDEDLYFDYIEIQKLRRRLATILSKLKELELIRGNIYEKAYELLGRCQQLGIYQSNELPSEINEYVGILNSIVTGWKPYEVPLINASVSELYDQIFALREDLKKKDDALYELKKYSNITKDFQEETNHQKNRLGLIDIFDNHDSISSCPLCSNDLKEVPKQIIQIKNDFEQIKNELGGTRKIKHYVEEIIEKLEKEKSDLKNDISKLTSKIRGFIDEQKDTKAIIEENLKISEIIGEVKLWLRSVKETDEKSELSKEKKHIEQKIKNLESKIKESREGIRRQNILASLSNSMQEWAKEVQIYQAGKYRFQYDVKTITLVYNEEKKLTYSNLGGGHNMLGIHLILYLALHKHFLENDRPVPHFVFFDQPSTPYFAKDPDIRNFKTYKDSERETLITIFKFIISKAEQMKNFQVIITDQAKFNESWFEKHLVPDWGDGLVPKEWG